MIRAAGIFFLTPDNQALFLKRGNGSDHPGEWAFPGGQLEPGETDIEAAIRETKEESGYEAIEENLTLHTHGIAQADELGSESVSFTTYISKILQPFLPTLCDEHTGFAWASIATPPFPLHPGAQLAIDRLTMDELGVARAMAAGQLTSPQVYKNVVLWNIRITGTGVSYRKSVDEYVHRQPEHYLTEEFLSRCNGLAVIAYHPPKSLLTSKEFGKRVVGSVFLPYISGNEVWAIAKVYDEDINAEMIADPASTSPAVMLGSGNNLKVEAEDGRKILIEGKPELLDHIALLPNSMKGVWDKGGDPTGVDRSGIIADAEGEALPDYTNLVNTIALSSMKLSAIASRL